MKFSFNCIELLKKMKFDDILILTNYNLLRGVLMAVSYKKLWKLLIDHDMKKKDLAKAADISNYTITKMSKGENITVETLSKICATLNCNIDDIVEFIPEERS